MTIADAGRRTFARDERGSTAVMFALLAVPMFGIAGAAIDFARGWSARSELQIAADAAALAAASAAGKTTSERTQIATKVFEANAGARAGSDVTKTIAIQGESITVTARSNLATTLLNVVGIESLDLEAISGARFGVDSQVGGRACLLALQPSDYGIKMNGDTAISANCGIYVNSASDRGIFVNGDGSMTSTYTCVTGNYDHDDRFTYTPAPQTGCPPMADPFASLPAPTVGDCTHHNFKVNNAETATLSPGVYCKGLDIGSDANVTFLPGEYIITDGQFKIGSHAIANGNGVFFYLTEGNSRFDFGSHAQITFRAPTTGTYKGILLYHDRNAWLSNAHRLGCHTNSILQGAIYSASTEIDIQSWGKVGASADWTVWVVLSLQMSSHAQLEIKTSYETSVTPLPNLLQDGMIYTPRRTALTN